MIEIEQACDHCGSTEAVRNNVCEDCVSDAKEILDQYNNGEFNFIDGEWIRKEQPEDLISKLKERLPDWLIVKNGRLSRTSWRVCRADNRVELGRAIQDWEHNIDKREEIIEYIVKWVLKDR